MPRSTPTPPGLDVAGGPSDASSPRPARRPAQLLVDFAAVWCIAQVQRLLLFTLVTGSVLPGPSLGLVERVGLAALRVLSSVPGALVFAVSFGVIRRTERAVGAIARVGAAVAWSAVVSLAFVSLSGWAGYLATHQFMGFEAWSLAFANPSLLIDHVLEFEPVALIVVPAAAIALGVLYLQACRFVDRWSPQRAAALCGVVAAGIVAAAGLAYSADRVSEHDSRQVPAGVPGTTEPAHEAFVRFAMDGSGPTARLLVDAFHQATATSLRVVRWVSSGERGRQVVTPAEYASRVARTRTPRLSVIVVLIESLRRDELVAAGGTRVVMPALEALAKDATVYTDVIAPAAQSDYATTSVLSSQFPLRGVTYHPFVSHIAYPRVLPYDILKPFGYRTAVFSSQNEYWSGMYYFLQTGSIDRFLHAETFNGPTYAANSDRGLRLWMDKTGHAGKIDDHDTIDEAIAWTDSLPAGTPFFAYVNLQSSHNPYLLTRPFTPRFGPGHVSFPVLFDVYPADSAPAVRDLYDNSLAYLDEQLGRLIESLKRSGRWNSTIIAVMGDHGEAFYEHGFGAHGSELYGEVTHVPLVIHAPGHPPARDTLPASGIDVLPTILGLLKLPPHPAHQGLDLADRGARVHRAVFSLTQTAMADEVAVEQDGWKLVFELRHSLVRLYDLRHDPRELHDVANDHPETRDALMGTVAAWWSRQIDYYGHLPSPVTYYAPAAPPSVPIERAH